MPMKLNRIYPLMVVLLNSAMPSLLTAERALGIDAEWLGSDDISYASTLLTWEEMNPSLDWSVDLRLQQIDVDYVPAGYPIDIVTEPRDREEQEYSLRSEFGLKSGDSIEIRPSLFVSSGWTSHTSIWLDEYYRQLWQGSTVPGDRYEEPDPYSIGGSILLKWDYFHSQSFLNTTIGYTRRTIAPGYDFAVEGERAGQLVRGIDQLDDWSIDIASDNVVTSWLRVQNGITLLDTKARDPRLTFRSSANIAFGEWWVLRLSAAYARESSEFDASRYQTQLVRDISYNWSLFGGFGYYRDSGEIEQANLATDAAPRLTTRNWTAGLAWTASDSSRSFRLSVGYFKHQNASDQLDLRFRNLYSEREWILLKAAYNFTF